jgi:dihydrolipoamide dehydrogenase
MPRKLLTAPAVAAHAVARLEAFGFALVAAPRIPGKAVLARGGRERDRFVGFVVEGVERLPAADKVRGYARFVDDTTLAVTRLPGDGLPELIVKAAQIVIATGSSPNIPPAWRALGERLVVNDDVFEWQDLPRSVAVFGPGVIGLELGQALHRLGVRVKIFGRGGGVGPLRDPAVIEHARRVFGAELYLDTDARADAVRAGDGVEVTYRALDGVGRLRRCDEQLARHAAHARARRAVRAAFDEQGALAGRLHGAVGGEAGSAGPDHRNVGFELLHRCRPRVDSQQIMRPCAGTPPAPRRRRSAAR